MEQHFLTELNDSQREAVMYCDGPSLIIAGAGSGKTRVLTYKIAYLLQLGMAPWNILALTFTNKAAREMKERIAHLIGPEKARYLCMGTFHSIFYRMLRTEHAAIGFPSDFTIYDATDAKSLIRALIKELNLDDKAYKPSVVAGRISAAKNRLILPAGYAADAGLMRRDAADNMPAVSRLYELYFERCRRSGAMDFDDLLLYTYRLLAGSAEICLKYKRQFQYILVDEFQDTNYAQHRILSLLTDSDSRICVVGDDAQSIYGFRGADISNILSFTTQYPAARTFKLECNYRSTGNIVNAANSVIRHNRRQIAKQVFSNRNEGEKLHLIEAQSDKDEAQRVARRMSSLRRRNVAWSEMAVLYRTNAQSRVFEETLRAMNIPYRIYGGLSFYQRKEIKDIMAYFRLVVNPYDEEALRRIINYPARGIGDTTQRRLQQLARDSGIPLWDVVCNDEQMREAKVNAAALRRLQQFRVMLTGFKENEPEVVATRGLYAFCLEVLEQSGIRADLAADRSPEGLSKVENVQELLNAIKGFEDEARAGATDSVEAGLADYLAQVSLLTGDDEDGADGSADKVSMMTIHSAKGLEFEAVFIVGLEEDLFPNQLAQYNSAEMEEERRLFYVALTRAKTYCYLSHAQSRVVYGKFTFCNPSPFLTEIDSRYVDGGLTTDAELIKPRVTTPLRPLQTEHFISRRNSQPAQSAETTEPAVLLETGGGVRLNQHIEHERFGRGKVLRIEPAGDSYKATVCFDTVGTKTLLLKFARFKTLD